MRCLKAVLLLLFLLYPATTHAEKPKPIRVLTSFSVIADWVRCIGGDVVQVDSMVGPDMDPHIFMPTPDTIRQIEKADVVVFNGMGLEAWWPRLLGASQYKGYMITCGDFINARHPHGHCRCGHHDPHDPHIWHSIPRVIEAIEGIAGELIKLYPQHARVLSKGRDAYVKSLKELDAWVRVQLLRIHKDKLFIVTAHDAFSYFGHEYGVVFKAPNGLSTDAEPSSKDLAALIELIREKKVKALFLENMTNPKVMNQLARETTVKIVGVLYSDALSDKSGPASTYVDMMRHNVKLMVTAMLANGS